MPREPYVSDESVLGLLSSVNINSSIAVYQQIENLVRFAVAAGKLKAKDQLPSVRELSEKLQLNPNTIAKAYRDLEVMGLVYTRRGMGVFISEEAYKKCRANTRNDIFGRLFEVVAESNAAGITKAEIRTMMDAFLKTDPTPYTEAPANLIKATSK